MRSRYLTPIANRPLITHVLGDLAQAGIEQFIIVSPDRATAELAEAVAEHGFDRADVSFITSDGTRGRTLVATVREAVFGDAVLAHSGDCLFPGSVAELQERFTSGDLDLVLLERGPLAGPSPVCTGDVLPIAPLRLPRDRPEGTAMILGPALWPVVCSISRSSWSVRKLVRAVQAAGHRVAACETGRHWCYSDSIDQLLAANRMLLDALPFDAVTPSGGGNDLQGRVAISASARVSRSTLRGPVLIGAEAVVEDAFVGPYTALGKRSVIRGAEIENAMVLDDAQVLYPGRRLEQSVIGERGLVSRSYALPTGLRLQVGPDARVILD